MNKPKIYRVANISEGTPYPCKHETHTGRKEVSPVLGQVLALCHDLGHIVICHPEFPNSETHFLDKRRSRL